MIKTMRDYFIPHKGNDHRPHILRPKAVLLVCLVAIVAQSAFLIDSSVLIPRSRLFGLIVATTLVDGTNAARSADGLSPLHENALLDAAAQEKANDMVKNNYFAHTSPSGLSPWYWFENVGYNFTSAGENLAVNFSESSDVTAAWMNSPEHRANIMNAGYTEIGMATAQGTYDGQSAIYVVELFGAPAAAPIFSPVATAQAATPPVAPIATKTPSKPAPKPAPSPITIVTTTESAAVAIQGAATQTVRTTASAPAPASALSLVPSASAAAVPQSNLVQQAAADPRHTVDYFYFALAIVFAIALGMDIFIKVRIQHPQVILGGMLVILIAGLFIVLNQHFGGAGVVVL